ncbi:dicarboxylate/amino acid:cation symporter [Solibacillus sp. MA9]|uniref:Dicarboxylate/amino acid:cation symporter n=1 Tax=Solibacillus palustris TaxID=2908203 RepID=A0ABS9UFM9_9BACL|nr:dicarboxylate/amino acid:cation symporter [Solibacillus sp. MA9]MCH7323171.1 dicarboxylate/amino acid:cation symporter [Solibacillus sp. MA9]
MKWWLKRPLYVQIFIGVVLGIILGLIFKEDITVIKPIGDIFLALLQFLVVPLTIFCLIAGILKMEDIRSLRQIGVRIGVYFIVTGILATAMGIIVALFLNPGKGTTGILEGTKEVEAVEFSFMNQIVSWFPRNMVQAMAETNMLQIIIASLIIGIALLSLGNKVSGLKKLANEGSDLMIKITEFIMYLSPIGILALVANMVGTLGTDLLKEVGRFILADYIGLLIVLGVIYPIIIKLLAKKNPFVFYKKISPSLLVAASTTSSNATLPVSMNVARKNLGIPEKVYGFTLPLGATVNMDGMAVGLGVISVFAANLYGLEITLPLILQFVFLGLVLSIGAAGVKGAGIIMSTILLSTLGLPLTLVPILAAIWPIIDIGHTTTNITGDLTGTMMVASQLDMVDEAVYEGMIELDDEIEPQPVNEKANSESLLFNKNEEYTI